MKKIPDNYFKGIICSICALFLSALTNAQNCSPEMLAAKYWQYRENLNKHFLLIDRDSTGYSARGIKTPFAGPWVSPPSDWDEEGKNKSGASGGDDDISAG